jgi:hypothetical protein
MIVYILNCAHIIATTQTTISLCWGTFIYLANPQFCQCLSCACCWCRSGVCRWRFWPSSDTQLSYFGSWSYFGSVNTKQRCNHRPSHSLASYIVEINSFCQLLILSGTFSCTVPFIIINPYRAQRYIRRSSVPLLLV